jgi:hypothetical protein
MVTLIIDGCQSGIESVLIRTMLLLNGDGMLLKITILNTMRNQRSGLVRQMSLGYVDPKATGDKRSMIILLMVWAPDSFIMWIILARTMFIV